MGRLLGQGWRLAPRAAVLAALCAAACSTGGTPDAGTGGSAGTGAATSGGGSMAEARALIAQNRLDEAQQLLSAQPSDPESLLLQGKVWLKRAETAPLPTPPPAPSPLPRGAAAPLAPEFKPEELQAVSFFEKAIASRPDYAEAHVALAELLAPHALRRHAAQRGPAEPAPRGRRRKPAPPPAALPDTGGVDVSVDRVVRAYQFALQGDQASTTLPEAMIGFGIQAGRIDAAEIGHQELLKRVREKPAPFIRYGDFLLNHKGEPEAAIEQYRQALIWAPDDDATRAKIAEIFLARGIQAFGQQQFASAEQQFDQAKKWITDRGSAQAQRLQDYQTRLREIRVR
jgi:tetratricopeptide (TPR) repeat protein